MVSAVAAVGATAVTTAKRQRHSIGVKVNPHKAIALFLGLGVSRKWPPTMGKGFPP